jgi:hypothetical protein
MNYHTPENEQPMDEIYAVISKDESGEGICSMIGPMGSMPLIFGHVKMISHIKGIMEQMAKDTGKTLKLCKYKRTEVLEEIKGAH